MLRLVQTVDGISDFEYEQIDKGFPDLTDYDVISKTFSSTRRISVETGWAHKELEEFLKTHEEACIYRQLSHKAISDYKVEIDNEPYLDLFGFPVFIESHISWQKHLDMDERFETNRYPEETLGKELYDYFNR